jgi:hypothetical protein
MPEIEIHAEHEQTSDPFSHRVGVLVGLIGILLSVVTILGHREHTSAVVHKTEANDQWAYYQAKKIKRDNDEIAAALVRTLGADPVKSAEQITRFTQDATRYGKEADQVKVEAGARENESSLAETKALRYDLGEGLLELGLVMTSLYFLARRRFFVALGTIAGFAGTVFGILGLLA